MHRDPVVLREAASLLIGDFDRALPTHGAWRIEVSDDFVVSVTAREHSEAVAISHEVDDPDWFEAGDTAQERHEALLADASEALAYELFEILRCWSVERPRCGHDGAPLEVCSGGWFCSRSHGVCGLGELTANDVAVS